MTELAVCIGDSARGQYMPLIVRELLNAGWKNVFESQVQDIEKALSEQESDTKDYEVKDEAWDEILEDAYFVKDNCEYKLRITDNGDLLVVNETEVMRHKNAAIEVCMDCYHYLMVGELPEGETGEDPEVIYKSAEKLGKCSPVPEEIQGEDLEDSEFSHSDCDCCGSSLGGARHVLIDLSMYEQERQSIFVDEEDSTVTAKQQTLF